MLHYHYNLAKSSQLFEKHFSNVLYATVSKSYITISYNHAHHYSMNSLHIFHYLIKSMFKSILKNQPSSLILYILFE